MCKINQNPRLLEKDTKCNEIQYIDTPPHCKIKSEAALTRLKYEYVGVLSDRQSLLTRRQTYQRLRGNRKLSHEI